MTITFLAPDGVAITAQQFRQAQAATHGGGSGRRLGVRSGFRVDTPSNVLTATSTTWTLTPCAAEIDPGATTHQGGYGWSSDANVTGSVTAADATYARKDIVYIQVNDSSAGDGSGALSAPVLYLAGVAAATPVAPTLPARSFLVGTISVPVAGGGSPTVVLNPARYVAAGAIQPVWSLAERDALVQYSSLTVRRMDVAGFPLEVSDGTAWKATPISAIYTAPALNISTAGGGPGPLTLDAANSQNPGTITSPASGQIQVADSGVYAFNMHCQFAPNVSGYLAVKNQAGTGTYALTNFPAGGEQSIGLPNLYLAAGAVVSFVIAPSALTATTTTIRITKIA
ncbi:hypothetical protein NIBR502772_06145 [Pseudarthrobacter sp. NIBRBAC000502772]|uniref:hypothetical protein n=1 Tax=Pseudarthrobacter sp. NIBRBAC000502772 TaxID=2590775 RepID=UPI001132038D|nr:hypothetical protein [Pseudarthrobacter sp. NIBRBAC000502772]QDG65853.1 hypothetical protein NIBR502772_06145 [Pseudarthrobacter sp. NIBRBAC000502772]